ncbi:MAG TPA: hypothetical protein VGE07_02465, partial [Herpetosiphonaceae bacterium]
AYAAALATDPVDPPGASWAIDSANPLAAAGPGEAPAGAEPADADVLAAAGGSGGPSEAGLVPKPFRDQVRRAISGLKNPLALANSPLLSHGSVAERLAAVALEDNRLNRAACLRELLIEHIEGLRPADDGAAPAGEARRFFNVLYYPYVAERSRKQALTESRRLAEQRRRAGAAQPGETEQVLAWLADVDENTFFKWQRKASDVIAQVLWDAHPPQA